MKVPEFSQDTVMEVGARDVPQLAEHVPNMYKALILRPSTAQTGWQYTFVTLAFKR